MGNNESGWNQTKKYDKKMMTISPATPTTPNNYQPGDSNINLQIQSHFGLHNTENIIDDDFVSQD